MCDVLDRRQRTDVRGQTTEVRGQNGIYVIGYWCRETGEQHGHSRRVSLRLDDILNKIEFLHSTFDIRHSFSAATRNLPALSFFLRYAPCAMFYAYPAARFAFDNSKKRFYFPKTLHRGPFLSTIYSFFSRTLTICITNRKKRRK